MNTSTKPVSPASQTLKVRTNVRAGYSNEQFQPDLIKAPRPILP